jgi:excisionase family DNA binding protein
METVIFKDQLDRIEAAILSQKIVLTFDEASVYTGLSKSDLYKKTSSRIIPHYKPRGKMIYFDRAELDKWLLQNRIATIDEIETQAQTYNATKEMGGNRNNKKG